MTHRVFVLATTLVLGCPSADDSSTGTSPTGLTAVSADGSGGDAETAADAPDDASGIDDDGATTTPSDTSDTGNVDDATSDDSGPFDDDDTTGEPQPPPFDDGHVFVVGFNDRLVFEYDETLEPVMSWTHPSFDDAEGPAGMVFDYRGFLVVASYAEFCVFSEPGVVEACHPKTQAQRTENVIFDFFRNLYTTTSTGGTDEIHKYDEDYTYVTTFDLPTGQLTGITCEPNGDLFVASQTGVSSTIYRVANTDLSVLDTFTVAGNAEGLQFAPDGNLLVALAAGVGIARVTPNSPSMLVDTIQHPGLLWPVPLTIDKDGNRYTGDFEDGSGVAASDLFVFAPDGSVVASREPSELHGPFGLVVAGTSLPCGAIPPG